MIGFYCTLFTLITITIVQAQTPAVVDAITATCTFGEEAFLGFVGTVTLTFGSEKRATKDVKAVGTVNNNPAKKWAANQKHNIQVHDNSDISGGICGNIGGVNATWGDAETDDNADLVFAFDIVDDRIGYNVDPFQLCGKTLVIQRNSSDVDESLNANVACCVITLVGETCPPPVATQPPPPPTTAPWPYPWPQGWVPPPGCGYIPASYVAYQASTTTTTTITTYNYVTTSPPPPPVTVKYDPYAPALPPPPPPPPVTYYYAPPVTTTTKATTAGYCWNCPYPDSYGNAPNAAAYYYVPCTPAVATTAGCVPSYYQPHCPASTSVLAMFAVLVAFLALLL